jgi:NAD(P)-dependent dehydrogenase (short-subunit alcohol dehydrogenase family)
MSNRDAALQSGSHLQGKIALITGANRGIGRALAQALASQGCDVVMAARDADALQRAAREVSPGTRRVLPVPCDVADPESVDRLMQTVKREFGHLDILINNAGVSHAMAPVERLPIAEWQRVIATNLTGMFLVTRAALPIMRAGGTIANNLSVAAKGVFTGEAAYCASKHGALGLTNTLREELRPRGIRVIAVLPGATDTDIWNQFWPEAPREKMMSPQTVAAAVVSALSLPANSTMEELILAPSAGSL